MAKKPRRKNLKTFKDRNYHFDKYVRTPHYPEEDTVFPIDLASEGISVSQLVTICNGLS
jgi:hypothetical protein